MNFSPPLSLQQQLNYSNTYNPSQPYFPPGATQINNPMQHQIYPGQDKMQRNLPQQMEDFAQINPVKKIKPSWNGEMGMENFQGRMMNPMQMNEPMRNNDLTSLINNNAPINNLNYYEQMMRASSAQRPNMEFYQNRDAKDMAALLNNPMNAQYLNSLTPMEQRQLMNLQNEMAARELMQFPPELFQDPGIQQMQMQIKMIQEMQNSIMNGMQGMNQQIPLEQLYMRGQMNPAMLNQLYNNENMMIKQLQNEQMMQKKMMEEAQKAEEMKRQYAELAKLNNMNNMGRFNPAMNQLESLQRQAQLAELNELSQFPMGHPMNLQMQNMLRDPMLAKLNGMESINGAEIHELEGKKTPETSLPTSIVDDSAIKELHDPSMADLYMENQALHRSGNNSRRSTYDIRSTQESPLSEMKQKRNPDETLLRKRNLDSLVRDQETSRKESLSRSSPSKPQDKLTKAHKLGGLVKQDDKGAGNLLDPFDPVYQEKSASSKSAKPSTQKPQPKLPQKVLPQPRMTPTMEEFNKAPKQERRMNKLQSMRLAMEDYLIEQKKPYTINIHINPADTEERIKLTEFGDAHQVPVAPWNPNAIDNTQPSRQPKINWDPSSLTDEKLEELQNEMAKIFGQDVTNQESALRILRGTGMNVESTLEIMRNNNAYFKAILFPEPKPLKTQRVI